MGYYVVVDLEMANTIRNFKKWYGYKQETIQIGAVLLDENCNMLSKFDSFVKPEYSKIDPFIYRLTGISNENIKDADTFSVVAPEFFRWIPKDSCIVSWSMTDRKQFREECIYKNLIIPRLEDSFETWIDCQELFAEKLNTRKQYRLDEALIAANIISEGKSHDGFDDAYNTALLFKRIMTEDRLVLNSYYEAALQEKEPEVLSFSMADVFTGINLPAVASC